MIGGMTGGPGWCRIGPDPAIARWAGAARHAARVAPPGEWRAGGTWDLGLDAVPNDADGSVAGVPFPWGALPLVPVPLHAAQVSTLHGRHHTSIPGAVKSAFTKIVITEIARKSAGAGATPPVLPMAGDSLNFPRWGRFSEPA